MTRLSELQCGAIGEAHRALEDAEVSAVEAPRRARDFVHGADWPREHFPDARLCDVEELVKLVNRTENEAHDWSLTLGRYVGIAPAEEGEDFDFGEVLRSIHIDIKGPSEEAAKPAAQIERSFNESNI